MPRDMAMERPDPRIVCVILEDDVTRRSGGARLNDLYIATVSILLMDDCAVPSADALG